MDQFPVVVSEGRITQTPKSDKQNKQKPKDRNLSYKPKSLNLPSIGKSFQENNDTSNITTFKKELHHEQINFIFRIQATLTSEIIQYNLLF